jgi:hypothetical protein
MFDGAVLGARRCAVANTTPGTRDIVRVHDASASRDLAGLGRPGDRRLRLQRADGATYSIMAGAQARRHDLFSSSPSVTARAG